MPGPHSFRRFTQAAHKWRDLVDLRCAHLVELHASGRWTHYYTEDEFLRLLDEAFRLAETWMKIAPRPDDRAGLAPLVDSDSVVDSARRTAA